MPLKKDGSGRRWVEVEVEVLGTPEEVWRAIASGPGISAWFVPTEIEEEDGRPVRAVSDYGPGMKSVAEVTDWDPPHRFSAESRDLGPDAPPVATEWIVEARGGGKCVVRVVHSLFASSDEWDDQLEGWESGWPTFFRILRLYLEHFRGQPSAAFQVMGAVSVAARAWTDFTAALGLGDPEAGERFGTGAGAPRLSGVVEHAGPPEHPELLVRLDRPAPGIAHLFALPMGGRVVLPLRVYLYGERAGELAAAEQTAWTGWIAERFPTGPPDDDPG